MSKNEINKIEDIFRLPINRTINKVVKVDQEDEKIVRQELEEYILTPILERNYIDILECIKETTESSTDEIGIWISGFFGSGKSHYMKILGYLLENKKLPHGDYAVEVFKQRTDDDILKGIIDRVTSLLNSEVLMFQIGSKENKRKADSITEIIFREFNRKRGFAETPWVAEIEKSLKRKNIYKDFRKKIKEDTGDEWEKIRTEALFARNRIVNALVEVDTDFENKNDVKQAIEDVKNDLIINPENLAERINNYIIEEGNNKRYFVFLDEISQFIGEDEDKLLELQAIAEDFEKIGKGKIWLGVTSQEQLQELIPGILAKKQEISKVMDRFPHRVNLTSEQIDKVVKERVLKKKENARPILKNIYETYSGLLSSNYKISSSRSLQAMDEENFIDCYPFLPYQIDILDSIFAGLRGKGGEDRITGRERTMIDVIHTIFNKPINFKEREIGKIIPMHLVFDEIQEEISDADLSTIKNVSLEDGDNELAKKVLKTLYLFQQLDFVPNSSENICTGLLSQIGEYGKLQEDVVDILKKLRGAAYVDRTEEGYRFLSQTERSLMDEIESVEIRLGDIRRRTKKMLKGLFENITPVNYEKPNNLFDLSLMIDDEEITTKGDIILHLNSPIFQLTEDIEFRTLKTKSHGYNDRIYWIADGEDKEELKQEIQRLMKSETVLVSKRGENLSIEEQKAIERKARDIESLKDAIRKRLRKSFQKGSIIYYGNEFEPDCAEKSLKNCLSKVTDEAIPRVYPDIEAALADVKDEDVENILKITDGPFPEVFEELGLIVDGELNTGAAICQKINEKIIQNEELSGKKIESLFKSRPYGWGRNVIQLGVAALFRNGEVVPKYKEKRYSDYTNPKAVGLFTSIRKFRNTIFEEQESVNPESRKKAKDLLNKLFDKRVKDTVVGVKEGILNASNARVKEITEIMPKLEEAHFPLTGKLDELKTHLNAIQAKQTPARIIKAFLEKEEELEELIKKTDKIIQFENKGKLDQYKIYRQFLQRDWSIFVDLAEKSDQIKIEEGIKETANRLKDTLMSEDIIENWTDAKTDHRTIANAYVKNYKSLYSKRHEVYSESIKEVKAYGKEVEDDKIREVISPLKERKGDETLDIDISKGEHINLDPSIDRIEEHIKTVQSYIERAKEKIDEIRSAKEETATQYYTIQVNKILSGKVVKNKDDIEEILDIIKNEIETKLASDKEVEIRFR